MYQKRSERPMELIERKIGRKKKQNPENKF